MPLFSEIQHACPECNTLHTSHKCVEWIIYFVLPEYSWKRGCNDLNKIAWKDCDYFGEILSDDDNEKSTVDIDSVAEAEKIEITAMKKKRKIRRLFFGDECWKGRRFETCKRETFAHAQDNGGKCGRVTRAEIKRFIGFWKRKNILVRMNN